MSDIDTALNKRRQAVLGSSNKRKRTTVQWGGLDWDVVELTYDELAIIKKEGSTEVRVVGGGRKSQQEAIMDLSEQAEAQRIVRTVILCTYLPGTDRPCFTNGDFDSLMAKPASFMNTIHVAAEALLEEAGDEGNGSEKTPAS